MTPPSTVLGLEAALRGGSLDEMDDSVARLFAAAGVGLLTAAPADFAAAIRAAAG